MTKYNTHKIFFRDGVQEVVSCPAEAITVLGVDDR